MNPAAREAASWGGVGLPEALGPSAQRKGSSECCQICHGFRKKEEGEEQAQKRNHRVLEVPLLGPSCFTEKKAKSKTTTGVGSSIAGALVIFLQRRKKKQKKQGRFRWQRGSLLLFTSGFGLEASLPQTRLGSKNSIAAGGKRRGASFHSSW